MRLISLIPSSTDCLLRLRLASSIVGLDTASARAFPALEVPDLGPLENPDLAKIKALNPDLVIVSDTVPGIEAVIHAMQGDELNVLVLHSERFDDVLADLYTIGVECGVEDIAREQVAELHARIKALGALVAPRKVPLAVYVELWPGPFVTIGAQNWISDMLRKAGARNIFSEVTNPSFTAEEEEILEAAPEIMLLLWRGLGDDPAGVDLQTIYARPNWSKVPAIAAKRVHILPESLFTYPGPRLIEGLELLINRFAAY